MILLTLCLSVLALIGAIAASQNDEKCLRRFGIVWLHIPQYQKGGVRPLLLIPPSFLLECRL